MNGHEPKIEIFEPFGAAYEVMKTILFRPFDAMKWLTIAFAAFLSGAWGGGLHSGFRNPGRFGGGNWRYWRTSHGIDSTDWTMPPWLIAALIGGGLLLIVVVVVFMWISARGRFIFTDCVVKNRGAIAEPWREFRREGNSYFLFLVVVAFIVLVLLGLLVLVIAVPMGLFAADRGSAGLGVSAVVLFIVIGLVWLVFSIFFAIVSQFMVPVMYRRRCSAREAFGDVARLVLGRPGPFILLALFGLVLVIALAIVGTIVACVTCCVGGLPYVSTVLLLPGIVWLFAFKLLFLRQFGDQYDVWATLAIPEMAVPPAAPPAGQGLPPPPPPV
ncbi:MAG: hypothetical protein QOF24_2030 [Verrucomicrobiota bacterium]|jgi:hypothetical protein